MSTFRALILPILARPGQNGTGRGLLQAVPATGGCLCQITLGAHV